MSDLREQIAERLWELHEAAQAKDLAVSWADVAYRYAHSYVVVMRQADEVIRLMEWAAYLEANRLRDVLDEERRLSLPPPEWKP